MPFATNPRDVATDDDRLHELTTPTLVVHGGDDGVCPATAGETLAAGLPRGGVHRVEGARRRGGVEAAAAVNARRAGWTEEHAAVAFD